jgi:hypothetical protein
MSTNNFLNKDNVSTLWDVITEENIYKFMSKDMQSKMLNIFIQNLKGFYDIEKTKPNGLIDMNKKYILTILDHMRKLQPHNPNKIKIHEEIMMDNSKEMITYEEIHNDKKSQFEQDLNKRKEDFINTMTVPVPKVPEFKDNQIEEPIIDMDKIIKEMMIQRNYEVDQINKNFTNDENNIWLKPTQTSIAAEKSQNKISNGLVIYEDDNNNNNNNNNNNKINKNVSWGMNETREFKENINILEEDIFKKLKKVDSNNNNNNNINTTIPNDNEKKIEYLENEIKMINEKLNLILNFITNK